MYTRTSILALVVVVLLSGWSIGPTEAQAATKLYAAGVLAYTNAERYKEGLPFLSTNTQLSQAAYVKMRDLFARQYFAHESPSGDSVSDLAEDAGYSYLTVGENLALGSFSSNKDVVEAWMDSPGHRANILGEHYSEIGVAVGRGMYEGRMAWIAVQAFGLPRSSCPALDTRVQRELSGLDARLELLTTIVNMREALIEEDGITRTEYVKRVRSYNVAAELYNKTASAYRRLAKEYNNGVDEYNTCIQDKVASIETH